MRAGPGRCCTRSGASRAIVSAGALPRLIRNSASWAAEGRVKSTPG
ncbi:hypothetical protein ACP26L_12835 [Paenibacillus sp. S-38]